MNFSEGYGKFGVETFYRNLSNYVNPHKKVIQELVSANCSHHSTILDLGAGGGEATLALPNSICTGVEPFIPHIFKKNTGQECLEYTFQDIINGQLIGHWDAVICSFSLHLAPSHRMVMLLWQLSLVTDHLYVLSPTKQPRVESMYWGSVKSFKDRRVYFRSWRKW